MGRVIDFNKKYSNKNRIIKFLDFQHRGGLTTINSFGYTQQNNSAPFISGFYENGEAPLYVKINVDTGESFLKYGDIMYNSYGDNFKVEFRFRLLPSASKAGIFLGVSENDVFDINNIGNFDTGIYIENKIIFPVIAGVKKESIGEIETSSTASDYNKYYKITLTYNFNADKQMLLTFKNENNIVIYENKSNITEEPNLIGAIQALSKNIITDTENATLYAVGFLDYIYIEKKQRR